MSMVAKLTAMLGLDASGFRAGANGAMADIKKVDSGFSRLGATLGTVFSFGAILEGARRVIEYVDNIGDAVERLGISSRSYQLFRQTFEDVGIESERLELMLNKLRVAQSELIKGSSDAAKKFAAFGLSADYVANTSIDKLFIKIAEASFDASGKMTKLSEITDLFGERVGPKAALALREIGQGLDKMNEGRLLLSDQTLKNIDTFEKSITKAKNATMALAGAWISFVGQNWREIAQVVSGGLPGAIVAGVRMARKPGEEPKGNESILPGGRVKVSQDADVLKEIEKTWARIRDLQNDMLPVSEQLRLKQRELLSLEDGSAKTEWDRVKLEEKRLLLRRDIASLQKQIDSDAKAESDRIERADASAMAIHERLMEMRGNMAEIRSGRGVTGRPIDADALARIGGFMGAQMNPMVGAADKALQVQEQIARATEENRLIFTKMETELQALSQSSQVAAAILSEVRDALTE